jgi:ATP-binding protein involved in chromosome partitioning
MSLEVVPPTRDEVFAVLRAVIDPELGADIVSLGMVPDVVVADDGVVTVTVKLTIGGCPLRADIKRDVEGRLAVHPGVTDVAIEWGEMNADERSQVMSTARWLARDDAPATAIPATCQIIAVASGKGGVGKSSVTANVATAIAASGYRVGVLDADIWGFSIPRLLGMGDRMEAERVDDTGKPKIIPNRKQVGDGELEVVSTGFLVEESTALMWRGLMLTKAVEQFLADVAWGDLDYLLIDMPPGTGDVQMGLARLLPRTAMLIVTTPARAAQKVAQRAADMATRSFLPVVGVIENMSTFECDHGHSYSLFGEGGGAELAESIDAPLIGQVPIEPTVAAGNDAGVPVALDGDGRAADEFRSIAHQLVTTIAPPASDSDVDMAGCSARMLDAVAAAFDD